jgi:hypothetical protein
MAFALLCSAKKGISALQLQRELDLGSYRTAWHLAHRIRHAMSKEPLAGLLKGVVEADETNVGGKPRKPAGPSRGTGESKRRDGGRSTQHRTPVVALVEREGGRSVAKPTIDATSRTLTPILRANIDRGATLMTDSWRGCIMVGREFAGGHHRVDHGAGEYARGSAHVNTAESFFALLKRGIVGSFHHVSPEHLHRYCDEFSFRWDYRSINDSAGTEIAIRQAEGKRLSYRQPTRG